MPGMPRYSNVFQLLLLTQFSASDYSAAKSEQNLRIDDKLFKKGK